MREAKLTMRVFQVAALATFCCALISACENSAVVVSDSSDNTNWERVDNPVSMTGNLYRQRISNGWLYFAPNSHGSSLCFVPDLVSATATPEKFR